MYAFRQAPGNNCRCGYCIAELEHEAQQALCIDAETEKWTIANKASISIVGNREPQKVVPNHAYKGAKKVF